MNLPDPPITSPVSPYRSVAKRAGLCRLRCTECDCSALVACALRDRIEKPEDLLKLKELPADILRLILKTVSWVGEIVSEEDVCGHIKITKTQPPKLREGSDSEL